MIDIADIDKHIARHNARRLYEQRAYYEGKHPAIYSDGPKEAPDNRVPVPIVRKAIKQVMGYMFRPGDITYSGEYYESTLKDIYDANEEGIVDAELAETALVNGKAFELHWTEDSQERFTQVPVTQSIPIYDGAIIPKMVGFIRYWIDDGVQYATTYDDREIVEYVNGAQGWEYVGQPREHGYKSVPVIEFTIGPNGENIFDHVLPLVDLLDQSISEDIANELQRFASAYLLMADDISSDVDADGESEVDKIKRTKIFARLGEGVQNKLAYLTKTIDPTFINTALDRTERLIYEMLAVPNPSDDTFNAQSGLALEYKLQPFEYLCASIQPYFTRGLQQRIRLIGNLDATINGTQGATSEVSINWHRNKPDDLNAVADVVNKLAGVVSDETRLKLFPSYIVPDVEKELAKIAEGFSAIPVDETPEPEDAPVEE